MVQVEKWGCIGRRQAAGGGRGGGARGRLGLKCWAQVAAFLKQH